MIEQTGWLIGPWKFEIPSAQETVAAWFRTISDPDSGQNLGSFRFAEEHFALSWIPRSRPTFQLLETEDCSEVMTIVRSWLLASRWILRDAENTAVGQIRRHLLCDGYGRKFARLVTLPERGKYVVKDFSGREYAQMEESPPGDHVRLCEPFVTNPFLKMIILGAFLSLKSIVPSSPSEERDTPGV